MSNVLKHMKGCHNNKKCTFEHCLSTKALIRHWRDCSLEDCMLCSDIRNIYNAKNKTEDEEKLEESTVSKYIFLAT